MGLFSDFQNGLRPYCSTADLLSVLSDKLPGFRSGATQTVALDISKAFDMVWQKGLHTNSSFQISDQVFNLMLSVLSERQHLLPLDGKSLQEIPDDAGVLDAPILRQSLFLLYLNDLPDDHNCNIANYIANTVLIILLFTLSAIRLLICGKSLS